MFISRLIITNQSISGLISEDFIMQSGSDLFHGTLHESLYKSEIGFFTYATFSTLT